MFCSCFSQSPALYFTLLLHSCIYYIFGCAARAVDARLNTGASGFILLIKILRLLRLSIYTIYQANVVHRIVHTYIILF